MAFGIIEHYGRTGHSTRRVPQRRRSAGPARADRRGTAAPGRSSRAAEPPGRHRRRGGRPLAGRARRAERGHGPPPGTRTARRRARRRLRRRLHAGRRGVGRSGRAGALGRLRVDPAPLAPATPEAVCRRVLPPGLLRRDTQPNSPLVRLGDVRQPGPGAAPPQQIRRHCIAPPWRCYT